MTTIAPLVDCAKLGRMDRLIACGILICLPALPAFAGEWGHWGTNPDTKASDRWADFAEAKPDLVPDAWLVAGLAGAPGDEVMLRSGHGAMLRWLSTKQMRYLYAVQQSIEKVAELEVTLYITRGDSPNAAAGVREGVNCVFVNFAMLDMVGENMDEWAALLGHEVAHLKLDHAGQQSKRNIPLNVLKTVTMGVLAADPLASTASGLLMDGIGMKFSRDAEREADYMGVIWAVQAHYDAYGAATLHELMTAQAAGGALPFLSSHPSGPERIKTLRDLADRLTGKAEEEDHKS
jgi:hypothetical protein